MPRLRGSSNQAAQTVNTLDLVRTGNIPETIGANNMELISSGVSVSKSHGKGRNIGGFRR